MIFTTFFYNIKNYIRNNNNFFSIKNLLKNTEYNCRSFNNIFPLILLTQIQTTIKKLYILYFSSKSKVKQITDPSYEYYLRIKNRYSSSFDDKNTDYNKNIDKVMYVKDMYFELIKMESNYLEKEWHSRILFETTPRGNIIMFYDPYKLGFNYYCDSNGIPYNILNAVAMKYVLTFYCRDFFVDDRISHYFKKSDIITNIKDYNSPLITLYFIEEKIKKSIKNSIKAGNSSFVKNKNYGKTDNRIILPFANLVGLNQKKTMYDKIGNVILNAKHIINKFYNYLSRIIFKTTQKIEIILDDNISVSEKNYNHNRFIQLGKISNFQFLQKPSRINYFNGFESNLLENLKSETALQKQVMSYSDFKKGGNIISQLTI